MNFKIKLQPMDEESDPEYSGMDNMAQTNMRSLHTISDVTEISSPNIDLLDRYSPNNPFYPLEQNLIKTESSKTHSSSKMWNTEDSSATPENVVPKIFVTRNSQEAIISSIEHEEQEQK